MIERFLFDRIDAEAAGAPVRGQDDLIALADAHKAECALSVVQFAQARAQVALKTAVTKKVPVSGGMAVR